MANQAPTVSTRIQATDTPVIAFTRRVMALRPDALSLAQGVVYWGPPPEAVERLTQQLSAPGMAMHAYSPIEGLPALRSALRHKLAAKNGLDKYNVLVTPGANQAFLDVLLVLGDAPLPAPSMPQAGSEAPSPSGQQQQQAGVRSSGSSSERRGVVLFPPYYFDNLMALQMTGSASDVVLGAVHPSSLKPDATWLRRALAGELLPDVAPPRMVVVVNPDNPTGVVLSPQELDELAQVCGEGGAWLVLDNTYEDFIYTDQQQQQQPSGLHWYCPSGPHILHLFSFSKAYGMMGWRVGYIAYPDLDGSDSLGLQIHKTLDASTICAPVAGQVLALACLECGEQYVKDKVASIAGNRKVLDDALSVLGPGAVHGGQGALYVWARLPEACQGHDDRKVVEWLVTQAGVCVVPGSAFGVPGHIRVSFANLDPEAFPQAASRLKRGLAHLATHGLDVPLQ